MEPINIPSFANRINVPSELSEEDFNYHHQGCHDKIPNITDFEIISTIGSGSFGEVFIVKEKSTQSIYALKKILYNLSSDPELIKKRAKRERDAMIICSNKNSKRAPKLYYAFLDQDDTSFNLVMEYISGGDFNSYCYKRMCDNNPFQLEEIKFYMAELVVCIENFHNLGFLHRDVKPENLMIDKDGHLVLCDFGSSKQIVSSSPPSIGSGSSSGPNGFSGLAATINNNTPPNFTSFLRNPNCSYTSYIGTPQYMAVEVVQGIVYSKLCDYWSLGAILYELVAGQALFVESPDTTEQKIRENIGNWRGLLNTAISKSQQPISKVAESLIRDLIAPERKRIDSGAIKKHPFFEGVDWQKISDRIETPPYTPAPSNPTDKSSFSIGGQ
ncbi:putative protein serine/threonine kinase [Cavenderia fasciculata]|uniref:non-specific serine/threonine protein kinase n=1 Tax=Cavenderia fasciculata TaxID=261658 RepID=F4PGD1_CACFS|nr:putative protein serine/threonine kinase [Cavenderia fasciculata]EGG24765.1 putative protein serine/threonine kinase [Cavenderia fasciculata]|eukprot:XP_004362616.1 putative protein serine/threonine kinase [Cavenderia fasciculata]